MWTNTGLRPNEYAAPVLGLLFLRCAEKRFADTQSQLRANASSRRTVTPQSYQRLGVVYLPEEARFSHLLNLPEGENIGKVINDAMSTIEETNEELKGVLPRTYQRIPRMETTDMAVVVSQSQNEIEDLKKEGVDISPHRRRMVKENLDEIFKDPDSNLRFVLCVRCG